MGPGSNGARAPAGQRAFQIEGGFHVHLDEQGRDKWEASRKVGPARSCRLYYSCEDLLILADIAWICRLPICF